ncbi:MAG: hypothetical protein JJU20_15105 [Opitutales bacterium]|nr:hypothetical protein [Opitutales bacterium]
MKIRNSISTLLASFVLAGSANVLNADWFVVDDFQSGMDKVFNWLAVPEADPIIGIAPDPDDSVSDNSVLVTYPQGYGVYDWAVVHTAIELPVPIPADGESTVYLRFYNTGNGLDMAAGLTPARIVPDPSITNYPEGVNPMSAPNTWSVLGPQFQMFGPGSSAFRVRNASAFASTPIEIPVDEWVEIWMHVNNNDNVTEFYVKRESDESPVLATFTDDFGDSLSEAAYRTSTTEPLRTFFMGTVVGAAASPLDGDFFYIDDLHVDVNGLNLTTPSPENTVEPPETEQPTEWAGYSVTLDGFVHTGDWLGVIYLEGNYVYSYRYGTWFYLPESWVEENAGAWAFAPR